MLILFSFCWSIHKHDRTTSVWSCWFAKNTIVCVPKPLWPAALWHHAWHKCAFYY